MVIYIFYEMKTKWMKDLFCIKLLEYNDVSHADPFFFLCAGHKWIMMF
jgi:hypothetical protein